MKRKTYIGRNARALDRLGNTLCAGDDEATISQRLGYLYNNRPMKWTTFLMRVVDWIFYPLDGPEHCVDSYRQESVKIYMNYVHANVHPDAASKMCKEPYRRGNDIALAFLGLIILTLTIPLRLIVWVYSKTLKENG